MISFQTKNTNLGKFQRTLDGKFWYILWPIAIFYDHLAHFSGFGIMYQEKSGNPALHWMPALICKHLAWHTRLFNMLKILLRCITSICMTSMFGNRVLSLGAIILATCQAFSLLKEPILRL
jgi:hypothetical protein